MEGRTLTEDNRNTGFLPSTTLDPTMFLSCEGLEGEDALTSYLEEKSGRQEPDICRDISSSRSDNDYPELRRLTLRPTGRSERGRQHRRQITASRMGISNNLALSQSPSPEGVPIWNPSVRRSMPDVPTSRLRQSTLINGAHIEGRSLNIEPSSSPPSYAPTSRYLSYGGRQESARPGLSMNYSRMSDMSLIQPSNGSMDTEERKQSLLTTSEGMVSEETGSSDYSTSTRSRYLSREATLPGTPIPSSSPATSPHRGDLRERRNPSFADYLEFMRSNPPSLFQAAWTSGEEDSESEEYSEESI